VNAVSRQRVAPSLPPLRGTTYARLRAAMKVVESLPPDASGALLVGPVRQPVGTILVEANRVCWAAAAGMSRRLRDLLRSRCGALISEAMLDALYARCRLERQPLGEALVASGLVSSDDMRATIKQHTAESLVALDAALLRTVRDEAVEWPLTWIAHAGRGYNPRYTFSVAEVLIAAGALSVDETTAELVTDHLQALAGTSMAAIAFCNDGDVAGGPVLVAAAMTVAMPVQELIELATWADAALAASAGFSPEVAHACARTADGGAVAWRYERQPCAAICTDGAALQRLTASLGNRSLSVVLATRMALLDRVSVRERNEQQTRRTEHGISERDPS
jgi:hypothetical protein